MPHKPQTGGGHFMRYQKMKDVVDDRRTKRLVFMPTAIPTRLY